MNNGAAVAVYADGPSSYEVGFVEYIDEYQTTLRCINSRGEPDGRRAFRIPDIDRVDTGNSYIKRIELLYQYRDSLYDDDFGEPSADANLAGQLTHAQEKGVVVQLLDYEDSGPSGYVKSVGEDHVVIERLGPNGEPDGESSISFSFVAKANIGRRNQQILGFLHRYNHGLKRLLGP